MSFLNNIREMKVETFSSAGAFSWGNTVNVKPMVMQKSTGGGIVLGDYLRNRQENKNVADDSDFMDQVIPFFPYW
ncbi:spore germination protein [Marininema mesophilum]|nr:spore germination protein [Marininema mesophilum]